MPSVYLTFPDKNDTILVIITSGCPKLHYGLYFKVRIHKKNRSAG